MNLLRKILQATQGQLLTEESYQNRMVDITFVARNLRFHVITFQPQAFAATQTPVKEDIIAERILQMLLERAARSEVERHSRGNWWPRDTGRLRDSITPRPINNGIVVESATIPAARNAEDQPDAAEGIFITQEMLNRME